MRRRALYSLTLGRCIWTVARFVIASAVLIWWPSRWALWTAWAATWGISWAELALQRGKRR